MIEALANRFALERPLPTADVSGLVRGTDREDAGRAVDIAYLGAGTGSAIKERFLERAAALAKVKNAGIATTAAHGSTEDGVCFLAMCRPEGESLDTRIARGAMTLEGLAKVIDRVLAALDFAHRVGAFHGLLRPESIVLVGAGSSTPVLGGFALDARVAAIPSSSVDERLHALAFVAPEQLTEGELSARGDVYGLGALLYWAITGDAAYRGRDVDELCEAILASGARLHGRGGVVGSKLATLVDRALARHPAERFPGPKSMRSELYGAILAERQRAALTVPLSTGATEPAEPKQSPAAPSPESFQRPAEPASAPGPRRPATPHAPPAPPKPAAGLPKAKPDPGLFASKGLPRQQSAERAPPPATLPLPAGQNKPMKQEPPAIGVGSAPVAPPPPPGIAPARLGKPAPLVEEATAAPLDDAVPVPVAGSGLPAVGDVAEADAEIPVEVDVEVSDEPAGVDLSDAIEVDQPPRDAAVDSAARAAKQWMSAPLPIASGPRPEPAPPPPAAGAAPSPTGGRFGEDRAAALASDRFEPELPLRGGSRALIGGAALVAVAVIGLVAWAFWPSGSSETTAAGTAPGDPTDTVPGPDVGTAPVPSDEDQADVGRSGSGASDESLPGHEAPAGPSTVVVSLVGLPEGASVEVDGNLVRGSTLRLPGDGQAHGIVVRTDGHLPWNREVTGSRDQTITVELEPAPAPIGASRPPRRGGGRRGGRTDRVDPGHSGPTGPGHPDPAGVNVRRDPGF